MCDLSRAEQGSLTGLLGDLQAAEARLPRTPIPASPLYAGYSGWRSGTSFQGAPGFRPQAAAAKAVSTNSTNVMTCTLVQ